MPSRKSIWIAIALLVLYLAVLVVVDNRATIFGSDSARPAATVSARASIAAPQAVTRTEPVAGGTITQYQVTVSSQAVSLYNDFPSNGGIIVDSLSANQTVWVDCQIVGGGQLFYRVPHYYPSGVRQQDYDALASGFKSVAPLPDCASNGK